MLATTASEMRKTYVKEAVREAADRARDAANQFVALLERNIALEQEVLQLKAQVQELKNESSVRKQHFPWEFSGADIPERVGRPDAVALWGRESMSTIPSSTYVTACRRQFPEWDAGITKALRRFVAVAYMGIESLGQAREAKRRGPRPAHILRLGNTLRLVTPRINLSYRRAA